MIDTADVIIVGAGSAGCVLAARLTETTGLRVLLLEAGDEARDPRIATPAAWPLLQKTAIDWDFAIEPQPHLAGRAEAWPRGRVVGGSSAIHAMGHMRGHRRDFEAWVRAGAIGWDHDTLLPFFMASESAAFAQGRGYGADGPLPLMQPTTPHPLTLAHIAAGTALGLTPIRDHNGAEMAGPTLNTMTIRDGRRVSVADAYLTAIVRARPGFALRCCAVVDRITFDGGTDAQRATGVRLSDGTQIAARAGVVLCAGSIASPMILMRSGIGPAQALARLGIAPRRDAPDVGANLQDHLLASGNVYAAHNPVPPTTTQHSESLTYIHARGQTPDDAPELVVGVVSGPVVSDALRMRGTVVPPDAYTLMFGITHPRSRGYLTLTSADPHAPPRIDPCYLTDPTDRSHFLEALTWARRLGHAAPYDRFRKAEVLPCASDLGCAAAMADFIAMAATTHHHPVGTCAMGGTVAPDLGVTGVQGVFVCDGSVLPGLTTGPVNAAIVAVAERGATLLARRLG